MRAVEGAKDLSDQEKARRIASGDEETTRIFVNENYPSVLRFMRQLTRNVDDAEDLTQQAFIQARQKMASYRGGSSLRTWLHRVAFHEYTHWKRKQRSWLRLADNSIAEQGYQTCIDGALLLDALHRLPAKLREAFLLFEVQELSLEEVAGVLGVPSGTVKSRLHHARKQLRNYLEETEEDRVYGKKVLEIP